MSPNNPFNQYKENSIYTASSEELTLMLYNGIIKFVMLAQTAIDNKAIEKIHNNITRAKDIISELQLTLDRNYEVSNNLALLYDYMSRRLVEANVKKDKAILEEVLGLVRDLRDTWAQAIKLARQQHGSMQQIAK
jgi:flagellar protein FliS